MAEDTSQKAVTKKKRSGRGAFILGLILICLAAVGAVFLISTGVSAVKKLTDKTPYGVDKFNIFRWHDVDFNHDGAE